MVGFRLASFEDHLWGPSGTGFSTPNPQDGLSKVQDGHGHGSKGALRSLTSLGPPVERIE